MNTIMVRVSLNIRFNTFKRKIPIINLFLFFKNQLKSTFCCIKSMKNNIEITNSAEVYLKKLIDGKDEDNLGIRIFIDRPGTPKAETCLAFCNTDEASKDDEIMHLELIDVYIDSKSIDFLKDAIVNFDEDNFDGQLTIKRIKTNIQRYCNHVSIYCNFLYE